MKNISALLAIDGGEVKSTSDDGVVIGAGIVFGSPQEPDRSSARDFFTSESAVSKKDSFQVPLYYEHGAGLYDEEIGEATLTKEENGWKAVAQIDLTSELGKKVYESVKSEQHGFSTGAMTHLVKRVPSENNTHWLKKWAVGELSLTKRPAERKAMVYAVKSVDGEMIEEPLDPVVIVYDAKGEQLLTTTGENDKPLELPKDAKSIEVKYVGGSVTYNLAFYDEVEGKETNIAIYEWGGAEGLVNHLMEVAEKAKNGIQSAGQMTEHDDMMSKSIDEKIAIAVEAKWKEKTSTDDDDGKISNLENEIKTLKEQLAEKETSLADREGALTNANEKIAQLEILAGAKETINKLKGK